MDTNMVQQFKKVVEDIVDAKLESKGITKYVSAVVSSVNSDMTVNVYLPPDNQNIISNLLNKTGGELAVGDSVEICTKNGKASNAWVAIKHNNDLIKKIILERIRLKTANYISDFAIPHDIGVTYGHNITMQAGGNLIIGAGEFANNLYNANGENCNADSENLYLGSDNTTYLYSNGQTIANRKVYTLATDGSFNAPGAIKSGGTDILLKAYPVGAIYMSSVSTSPAKLFGGNWTQLKDRFVYACGRATDTGAAAGKDYQSSITGSDVSGTAISVNQMPSHTHNVGYYNSSGNYVPQGSTNFKGFRYNSGVYSPYINAVLTDMGPGGYTANHFNQNTGGGATHNHAVPFVAVYVWQRTS